MKRCFVISPIGQEGTPIREHADDVFDFIIKPAMDECGIKPVRSDQMHEPGKISDHMFRAILNEDLCIALLTGFNPNVFYELGLGHALGKPAILITDSAEEVPFDVGALRIIVYDKNKPDWGEWLGEKIQTAIEEVLAAPADAVLPMFLIENNLASLQKTVRRKGQGMRKQKQSAPIQARPTQSLVPRMSIEDATKSTRDYLDSRAPVTFILSALEYYGFEKEIAQTIYKRALADKKANRSGEGDQ